MVATSLPPATNGNRMVQGGSHCRHVGIYGSMGWGYLVALWRQVGNGWLSVCCNDRGVTIRQPWLQSVLECSPCRMVVFLGWHSDGLVKVSCLSWWWYDTRSRAKKHLIQYPQFEYQPLMENPGKTSDGRVKALSSNWRPSLAFALEWPGGGPPAIAETAWSQKSGFCPDTSEPVLSRWHPAYPPFSKICPGAQIRVFFHPKLSGLVDLASICSLGSSDDIKSL